MSAIVPVEEERLFVDMVDTMDLTVMVDMMDLNGMMDMTGLNGTGNMMGLMGMMDMADMGALPVDRMGLLVDTMVVAAVAGIQIAGTAIQSVAATVLVSSVSH